MFNEGQLIFENDSWKANTDTLNLKILVFDQKYVYENLFIEKVESDHKKNIHKIIIGEEGVRISQELTREKENAKKLKQTLDDKKRELTKKKNNSGRSDYLEIDPSEEKKINKEKEDIEKQIRIYEERINLLDLVKFPKISLFNRDFSKIEENLSLTIENIHEQAKDKIKNHINYHMKNESSAYNFLREGMNQVVDVCPFCGQSFNESENLVNAYQKYFDETYSDSIKEINKVTTFWSQWDPSAEILSIQRDYEQSRTKLLEINKYIKRNSIKELKEINFEDLRQHALQIKKQIVDALEAKTANLSQIVDFHFLDKFGQEVDEFNRKIKSVNKDLGLVTKEVSEKIDRTENAKSLEQENELQKIIELQKRFSQEEIKWCDEYKRLENDHQEAQQRCKRLTDELSDYSTEIIGKYQIGMNEVLEELGVDFRIRNLSEQVDNRAKQPFVDFQVEINDMPVSTKDLEDTPCFQNTLSGGEKNTLSFAFFVTSLKQMGNLTNTIVVFDDPLSSMDDNRRSITARIIKDLGQQTKQMIVLTHKRDFLQLLYEKIGDCQVLSIKKDKVHGSQIIPLDIDKEFKTEQQRIIENLYKYIEEDFCPVKDIQADVRICLENALKFKYFMHIKHLTESQKTLGTLIRELKNKEKLDETLSTDLMDLNSFSCPQHHGSMTEDPMKTLTYTETVTYVRKAISVLELL